MFALLACGGTSKGGGGGGSGSGGSGASQAGSATGGSASGSASGGNATGGTGGSATGGLAIGGFATGGEAPIPGSAECRDDEDCAVFDDCCNCSAGPVASPPAQCDRVCIQSACAARRLEGLGARCVAKRCVLDTSCDTSTVTCKIARPDCAAGQLPSVVNGCFGPCVAASDCSSVAACSDCAADQVCATDELNATVHCVDASASCAAAPTCACTDACSQACSDENGISCSCSICGGPP